MTRDNSFEYSARLFADRHAEFFDQLRQRFGSNPTSDKEAVDHRHPPQVWR